MEEAVSELDDTKTAWFLSCLRRNIKIPEPPNSFIVSKLAQG
ncbi:hypothetical protein [Lactobacillus gasseri]|nr:hypothetical protein [Lactobacillus gasseri]